jgi:hypothetical protein
MAHGQDVDPGWLILSSSKGILKILVGHGLNRKKILKRKTGAPQGKMLSTPGLEEAKHCEL